MSHSPSEPSVADHDGFHDGIHDDVRNDITSAFSALSHEVRLRIVHLLLVRRIEHDEAGEFERVEDDPRWMLFKALRAELDLGQSTLSYHLEQLEDGGLIRRETAGRCTYLTANPGRMREMARFLLRAENERERMTDEPAS